MTEKVKKGKTTFLRPQILEAISNDSHVLYFVFGTNSQSVFGKMVVRVKITYLLPCYMVWYGREWNNEHIYYCLAVVKFFLPTSLRLRQLPSIQI